MTRFSVAFFTLAFVGICLAGPSIIPVGGPLLVSDQQLQSYKPYEFGFEFGDGLGMHQHRREVGDAFGAVRGSYGYVDPLGVNRVVEYKADGNGYKAVVRSNEPGSTSHNAADAVYLVRPPPPAAIAQELNFVVRK